MKKYYENITSFTKRNAGTIMTVIMLMIAGVCVTLVSRIHEDKNVETTERFLPESTSSAKIIENDPTAAVETRFSDIVMKGQSQKKTKKQQSARKKAKTYTSVRESAYVVYNVNVRNKVNGKKIGYLYAGDKIVRTGIGKNDWSRIEYEGKTAYVYSYYLTTNKAQVTNGIKTASVMPSDVSVNSGGVSNKIGINVSAEDYNWLLQIVQAEAGNQDEKGRILVANTIINRVKSNIFPNTITGVIFQSSGGVCQFSPVKNGTIYSVNVDDITRQCVNRALNGENYSDEILYFSSEKNAYSWHNTNLAYLFTYGAHAFYK